MRACVRACVYAYVHACIQFMCVDSFASYKLLALDDSWKGNMQMLIRFPVGGSTESSRQPTRSGSKYPPNAPLLSYPKSSSLASELQPPLRSPSTGHDIQGEGSIQNSIQNVSQLRSKSLNAIKNFQFLRHQGQET